MYIHRCDFLPHRRVFTVHLRVGVNGVGYQSFLDAVTQALAMLRWIRCLK